MSTERKPISPGRRGTARRRPAWSSAAALLWGLAFFVLGQLALSVYLDRRHPEVFHPEYGHKRIHLRALCRANPGKPLLVVLGSSRPEMGFRPQVLSGCQTSAGEPVVVFNFAMTSSGPVQELLCLRRLMADGIRPRWVLVEMFPPFLNQEGGGGNRTWLDVEQMTWNDLGLLRRYCERPWLLYSRWLWSRRTPGFSYRLGLMKHYAPRWLPPATLFDVWVGVSASGWVPFGHETVGPADYQRGVARARAEYYRLLQDFQLRDSPLKAARELLDLCRQEGIGVGLFLMPEGSEFRSWYPPSVRVEVDNYLTNLSKEYGVPVVDARTWMADEDFFDCHHLLPRGAAAFTQRFEREALQPFLAGQLRAGVLHGRPSDTGLDLVQGAGR
jgi:hypothetical protein